MSFHRAILLYLEEDTLYEELRQTQESDSRFQKDLQACVALLCFWLDTWAASLISNCFLLLDEACKVLSAIPSDYDSPLVHWDAQSKPEALIRAGVLAFLKFSVSAVIGDEWMRLAQKAESLSNKGRHAEAAIAANQALQLAENALEPDHPDIAVILNCLGTQYFAMGQFEQAEPLYKRALANAEKALGSNDLFIGVCLNNLAEAYDAQGKSEQTEGMYLRALSITEKGVDANSRTDKSNLAIILTNLASWYARQSSYEQAEQLYERAIEIWEDETGILFPDPPKAALSFDGLHDQSGPHWNGSLCLQTVTTRVRCNTNLPPYIFLARVGLNVGHNNHWTLRQAAYGVGSNIPTFWHPKGSAKGGHVVCPRGYDHPSRVASQR